jgi:hypothetical protein
LQYYLTTLSGTNHQKKEKIKNPETPSQKQCDTKLYNSLPKKKNKKSQTLASAAVDTGMGAYDLTPTFQLLVPAGTYAGAYTATFTVSILSSP